MVFPDTYRNAVAFLAYPHSDTAVLRYCGTAFGFAYTSGDSAAAEWLFVTARHVIDAISARSHQVFVRGHGRHGNPAHLATAPADWLAHPTDTTNDVALLRLSPEIVEGAGLELYGVPHDTILSPAQCQTLHIGAGHEVFVTGLFVTHAGAQRNIPIVRTGTIAAMPGEPVRTGLGQTDAFLIEVRSIGGLSGSPVFVTRSARANFLTATEMAADLHLIGLVHGHFNVQARDQNDEIVVLNQGIAVVTPAAKIMAVLDAHRQQSVSG